ncbi:mediator of RNA polymerase II transcription subunit 30 isoform X2 [Micropterus salmoides]|uniref:mediator of RNA polymerase II transcription subunit 30 isoform X2 n=1 Tax=Micropterus salmoides TaxID=27706 RepID=UPI0018ECCDF6|nr:mediator of RNA polymerase II transcription subunit 30 isoform X2 [Micropterus salmoides]
MTTPPLVSPFGGQPPPPQQQQQAQAARDVNTASLCRIGQEAVQDIVLRTMEIFQLLRNMQLPNGVTYHPNTHQDRLGKLQEHLRTLSVLFRKLRLVYDKCNENCAGMDSIPPEVCLFSTHSRFIGRFSKPPALLLPEVTTRGQRDVKQQAVTLSAFRSAASPEGSCTSASL